MLEAYHQHAGVWHPETRGLDYEQLIFDAPAPKLRAAKLAKL